LIDLFPFFFKSLLFAGAGWGDIVSGERSDGCGGIWGLVVEKTKGDGSLSVKQEKIVSVRLPLVYNPAIKKA
jgi:hypothetical protein